MHAIVTPCKNSENPTHQEFLIKQGSHMSWKSWKSPGFFFNMEKSLKSIQISQFFWKLSAIPGNFRIPLQLQRLCMYKALILFLIHQC